MAVSERSRVVALLHDVFEDAPRSMPGWLTNEETCALIRLTHDKAQPYEDYIWLLAVPDDEGYEIACEVKRADLHDNLSNNPPPHLKARYEAALQALRAPQSEQPPLASRSTVDEEPMAWVVESRKTDGTGFTDWIAGETFHSREYVKRHVARTYSLGMARIVPLYRKPQQ